MTFDVDLFVIGAGSGGVRAARVAAQRPDLAPAVRALCRRYSDLRYAATAPGTATAAFVAAVRDFKPRGSRGSS